MKKTLSISMGLLITTSLAFFNFTQPLTSKAETIKTQTTIAQSTAAVPTIPGYITGEGVRVRQSPSTTGQVLGYVSKSNHDIVAVTKVDYVPGWTQILNPFGSGYAYVSSQYIEYGSID